MASISKRLAAMVKRNGRFAWGVATDRRLSWAVRAPTMLALAYVASPIDLVPDFLPGFGWLDDVLVMALAVAVTLRLVPKELIAEHGTRAYGNGEKGTSGDAADFEDFEPTTLSWLLIVVGAIFVLAAFIAAGIDLSLTGAGIDSP
jgi:uncharacterized membrane protein YkvA (DUF1232 family)